MLQRFQDRVGTAGLIVAIVALVLALGGGAYAASGALTSKQKKEVTKIAQTEAKKFAKAGPTGPEGKQGPSGAAGAKGDTGAKGENGAAGTTGTNGTPGTNGKSVEVISVPTGQTGCGGNGGAVLEPEEVKICNGSPWVAGALPKGATETGAWSFSGASTTGEVYAPISFAVPLSGGLAENQVHFVPALGGGECNGNAGEPKAPEGVLCVYQTELTGATFGQIWKTNNAEKGASKGGAFIFFEGVTAAGSGIGSWAVTGG
jgi:hypothetical protein